MKKSYWEIYKIMIGFHLVNFVFNPIKAMKNIMKEFSIVFIYEPNFTTRLFN